MTLAPSSVDLEPSMISFEPLRDFFHARQAARLDALSNGLQLVEMRRECHRGNFIFPGQDITVAIEYEGRQVGEMVYCVSPLNDKLYVSEFEILAPHSGQGLGLAALWRLTRLYSRSLASMQERGTSIGFWDKAERRFAAAGVHLERDIRSIDEPAIMATWAHLVPESTADRSVRKYWEWVAAERAAGREAGPGIPCVGD